MNAFLIVISLILACIGLSQQQRQQPVCNFVPNLVSDAPYFAVYSRVSSATDCCTLCQNNPSCQLYTFSNGNGRYDSGSSSEESYSYCYLKSSIGNLRYKYRNNGSRTNNIIFLTIKCMYIN